MKTVEPSLQQDLDFVLQNSGDIWETLRNQQIFITGGTGFVGRWLVESLIWANDRLGLNTKAVLLTRYPKAFESKAPHLVQHGAVRLHQGEAATFVFPEGEFGYVIHGATEPHVAPTRDNPTANFDLDLQATHRVLDFARGHGTKRFLFTSSGKAYGDQPHQLTHLTEDYPGALKTTDLSSPYGHAKHASEFICSMYGKTFGFVTVLARLFAFSGPFLPLDLNFAIGNFIGNALRGEPIRIGGDGTPYRSYLYGAEMAIWIWTLLIRGESRLYNVGSDQAVTIEQLARAVARSTVPAASVVIARQPAPDAIPARYVPAVARVREELGLSEILNLDEQIRRMYAWNKGTK